MPNALRGKVFLAIHNEPILEVIIKDGVFDEETRVICARALANTAYARHLKPKDCRFSLDISTEPRYKDSQCIPSFAKLFDSYYGKTQ